MRVAPQIILNDQDRSRLESLAIAPDTPEKVAQRARIILLAAQGEQNKMIAPRLGIGRAQVARWRERYARAGLDGILHDLPRGAAPPVGADAAGLAMLITGYGPGPYSWIRHAAPHAPAAVASAAATARADASAPRPTGAHALSPAPAGAEAERLMLPITSAKLLPPRGARRLMPREALMGRLLDARRHRCVVIQGQAGSGKTSTLMAWRQAMISLGHDVCWLSLSAEDNEPARFLDHVLASIAGADPCAAGAAAQVPGAAAQVPGAARDESAIELWAITLVQGLARRQRELVLMIDDLHHISDPGILQALQWLLEYAPPQLHVALASRTALNLSLERLRLRNQLAEFDLRDLRFSFGESARYLRDQLGGTVSSSDAAALHALTDGWVAGLQRLAITLRTRQAGVDALTQVRDARAFAGFFEREVLGLLAPDDFDMLSRVAICQRFCAPLCAEILGQTEAVAAIRARVSRMVADHLFITVASSHDNEAWYRLHPLLRETLLGYLAARDDGEIRALHAAAWRWFDARGHIDEAVPHAVSAGEPDAAATLVEGRAQALLVSGELDQVANLLRMLPPAQVRTRFRLHVVRAYMLLYARDFDGLRRCLDEMDAGRGVAGASGRYTLSLLRAGMALHLDDIDAAATLLPEIWHPPPDADDFTWHARANVLSWLLVQRGEHDVARGILEEADRRSRSPRSRQFGRCIHAHGLVREGRIRQASAIVREVLEEAEGYGPGYAAMASMAAGLLADALYELDETEAACQLLEPRIGMMERTALPEVVLRASLLLSNSHWIGGRRQQALACLDRLEAYAVRHGLDRLLAVALAQRLRRHLQQGAMERAGIVLACAQGLAQRHAGGGPEHARQVALAATRAEIDMALHTHDFAGALARIQPLLAPLVDAGEQRSATASLRMQLAIARQGMGASSVARQDFVEACRQGHRLGLSRTLLDVLEAAPDAAATLLRQPLPDPVLGFYVQRLLGARGTAASDRGATDARPHGGAIALLSEREREILHLLAQAMSNKKIARVLNVSAETVKWHLKNIYGKLGVGGRGGAAALLRDLTGVGVAPA